MYSILQNLSEKIEKGHEKNTKKQQMASIELKSEWDQLI